MLAEEARTCNAKLALVNPTGDTHCSATDVRAGRLNPNWMPFRDCAIVGGQLSLQSSIHLLGYLHGIPCSNLPLASIAVREFVQSMFF